MNEPTRLFHSDGSFVSDEEDHVAEGLFLFDLVEAELDLLGDGDAGSLK